MNLMQRLVMLACAALLLTPMLLKSRKSLQQPAPAAFAVFSGSRITVKISGAVEYAGIYEVPANALADSVIKMAQLSATAKHYGIDTTAKFPLQNGADVRLEATYDGSLQLLVDRITVAERLVLGIPLDISYMNESDFVRLPGIGPVIARQIMQYRHNNGGYMRVSDLAMIDGIGEKKYQMLKPYFQHVEKTR